MQQIHVGRANEIFSMVGAYLAKNGVQPFDCQETGHTKECTVARCARGDLHDFSWSVTYGERTSIVALRLSRPKFFTLEFLYDGAAETMTFTSTTERAVTELFTWSTFEQVLTGLLMHHDKARDDAAAMAAAAV